MTRYVITARPNYGPFGSATEALLLALLLDLPLDWRAVSWQGFTFPLEARYTYRKEVMR